MPSPEKITALNSALVRCQPLVAVFFGGTGGIGQATLRQLAKLEAESESGGGKGLRAYVVGRKAEVAEAFLAECRAIHPEGEFAFVKAENLALLKNVDAVCAEIARREEEQHNGSGARIDYLMFGQGGSPFNPRIDTAEGLDEAMALLYYSRMRATLNLLPLLTNSPLPATVVSVYAAGMEAKLFPDDLSLRAPKRFSYALARSHMVYMHTLFFESLAEQHPDRLRLVHVFPGLVLGPAFQNPELPRWFRVVFNGIAVPLFGRFVATPPEVCAQRMLAFASTRYPARSAAPDGGGGAASVGAAKAKEDVCVGTDGKHGSGAYALGDKGEDVLKREAYTKFDKDEMRRRVWEHTLKAFSVIEAGGKFTE